MKSIRLAVTLASTALFFGQNLFGIDDYTIGADSQFNAAVPHGDVTKLRWENSKIFPGTMRDWWIYVPTQYDASKPAAVMVFCDGRIPFCKCAASAGLAFITPVTTKPSVAFTP